MTKEDGSEEEFQYTFGELNILPLEKDKKATLAIKPAKGFDLGEGSGVLVTKEVKGGVVGIIIDTRGRPFALPDNKAKRIEKLQTWYKALDIYPGTIFDK